MKKGTIGWRAGHKSAKSGGGGNGKRQEMVSAPLKQHARNLLAAFLSLKVPFLSLPSGIL